MSLRIDSYSMPYPMYEPSPFTQLTTFLAAPSGFSNHSGSLSRHDFMDMMYNVMSSFNPDTKRQLQELLDNPNEEQLEALNAPSGLFYNHTSLTNFDFLRLLNEFFKLEITSDSQEKTTRRFEREHFVKKMEEVVENYNSQGTTSIGSTAISGAMAILSGLAPIMGQFQWAKNLCTRWITPDLKAPKFFENVGKMLFAMSEMGKNAGQIHHSFAEGGRNRSQYHSELARTDGDEATRNLESIKTHMRTLINMIQELMQMDREVTRSIVG